MDEFELYRRQCTSCDGWRYFLEDGICASCLLLPRKPTQAPRMSGWLFQELWRPRTGDIDV